MRKSVLLIAFFFPPSRSSGVHRALAIANYLAGQGHEVTVLTTTRYFFELEAGPADDSLLDQVNSQIRIIRVPFSFRPIHRNISLISRKMARLNPVLRRLLPASLRSRTSKLMLRSGGAFFPPGLNERYRTWYGPATEAATSEIDIYKLDLIIATGNPWTSFTIARSLSQLGGAPYVMDYRDPWKIDVRSGLAQVRQGDTEDLEASLLRQARYVTLPNHHLAESYCSYFPEICDRVEVVENGFDEWVLPDFSHMRSPRNAASDPMKLGTLGTASDMWPLDEFGVAWRSYHRDHTNHRFELAGHLGWFDSGRQELLAKVNQIGEGAGYLGPVERSAVPGFYANLDAVIMFLWGDQGLTAGKMYEVAALGLPVMCIQPEGGGVRTFLEREHPFAVCVNPEPAEILSGLDRLEQLSRKVSEDDRRATRSSLLKYERFALLEPIARLLDEVTAT